MDSTILRMGELFSGAGGLALGAKHAGKNLGIRISHEWAIDFNADACETYRKNIADSHTKIINSDIRSVEFNEFNPIDILAFGFPCNDFSVVGEQKGVVGEFGNLYLYCSKALSHFNPACFVAENVSGLQNANGGKAFKTILRSFANASNGYNLSVHLYKAEDYGVPQTRHRIIIVGFAKNKGICFSPPKPTYYKHVTVKEALMDLPADSPNNEKPTMSSKVVERLGFIPPGGNAWSPSIPEDLRIKTRACLSQIYKRLDPEKPSYTITGSGGGGTHVYHWSELRALTNRERARLQSFPDDFVFLGSRESVRRQIGMAVPPLLAQAVFTAIIKKIRGDKYENISENISANIGDLFNEQRL